MPTAKRKTTKTPTKLSSQVSLNTTNMDMGGKTVSGHPEGCKCLSCSIKNGTMMSSFKGKNFTPVLMVLLVVAVFFIGILVDKVITLQSQNTQTGTQAAAGNTAQGNVVPGQKVNVGVGHLPALGNKNAPIKIIEFADLRCPFCDQFHKQTEPQIISDYVNTGKASFYFRHYAFLGQPSVVAANAAECANEQGKFWDMHNYLYENQPDESDTSMYNTASLTTIAGQLGMNTTQFQSCLSSNKYQKNVDGDLADGQKAGVSGTPTFFINGVMLVGALPYSSFKTAIDCISNNGTISVNQSNGAVTCSK